MVTIWAEVTIFNGAQLTFSGRWPSTDDYLNAKNSPDAATHKLVSTVARMTGFYNGYMSAAFVKNTAGEWENMANVAGQPDLSTMLYLKVYSEDAQKKVGYAPKVYKRNRKPLG